MSDGCIATRTRRSPNTEPFGHRGIDLAPLVSGIRRKGSAVSLLGGIMKKAMWSFACVVALAGATGCAQTAKGVVQDTKENASTARGAVETVDVKTAIIADKEID